MVSSESSLTDSISTYSDAVLFLSLVFFVYTNEVSSTDALAVALPTNDALVAPLNEVVRYLAFRGIGDVSLDLGACELFTVFSKKDRFILIRVVSG